METQDDKSSDHSGTAPFVLKIFSPIHFPRNYFFHFPAIICVVNQDQSKKLNGAVKNDNILLGPAIKPLNIGTLVIISAT